jgi:hypothetical protein
MNHDAPDTLDVVPDIHLYLPACEHLRGITSGPDSAGVDFQCVPVNAVLSKPPPAAGVGLSLNHYMNGSVRCSVSRCTQYISGDIVRGIIRTARRVSISLTPGRAAGIPVPTPRNRRRLHFHTGGRAAQNAQTPSSRGVQVACLRQIVIPLICPDRGRGSRTHRTVNRSLIVALVSQRALSPLDHFRRRQGIRGLRSLRFRPGIIRLGAWCIRGRRVGRIGVVRLAPATPAIIGWSARVGIVRSRTAVAARSG